MPRKSAKHPKQMTTDEALKHLFHPEVVKHVKTHAKPAKKTAKKST